MTDIIVEIGPGTVRGPNAVPLEWVSAALEWIDDDMALIDDHPVSVTEVWQEVLRSAVGARVDTVVLVCPTWWASSRIDLVCAAARTVATNIVALQRTSVLREGLPNRPLTVVEVAADFVVVSPYAADAVVVPRRGAADVDAVASAVGGSTVVLVDAPTGVDGAGPLGAAIVDRARANGMAVSITDGDRVRRAATTLMARELRQAHDPAGVDVGWPMRRTRRGAAVLTGALVSAATLCGGFAMQNDTPDPVADDMPLTLLVEGRLGVKVPAQWVVERITSGPGSARVQIVSSQHPDIVLHITQSSIPRHHTWEMAAESLRQALNEQPLGVFVDFNPADRRVDRPAVTYQEMRADHHIQWVVLVDDALRIAIGCQSAPGREQLVRDVCDQAVQSAHAVF